MPALRDAPLAMIWRRVENLPGVRKTVLRLNGWPEVGSDSYSTIYDAGTLLVGFWDQHDFRNRDTVPSDISDRLSAAAADSCSINNDIPAAVGFNPSNQLIVAVDSAGDVRALVRDSAGRRQGARSELAETADKTIALVDQTGSSTRYRELSSAKLDGRWKRRLEPIRELHLGAGKHFNPVLSYELLTSDLKQTLGFYQESLGFQIQDSDAEHAVLDVGTISLTLRSEPARGLVQTLRRSGKLREDLLVFHHPQVEKAVAELEAVGIRFPNGIEDSNHGRLAIFEDPEGHSLSVWEPPQDSKLSSIDYFSQLDRVLTTATAAQ